MMHTQLYPRIDIPLIKNPNRFYAFPLFGGIVKFVMLIPVFIWMALLGIAVLVTTTINSFVVLFTGNYWKVTFDINLLVLTLSAKVAYFFAGLTNRYPGFDKITPDFTLTITYPKHPSKFFAIPVLGGLVRLILMIPFFIYAAVMQYAANASSVVASFPVLFMGKYPEALYELPRDNTRLSLAIAMYLSGLSDSYPSFWVSMKHKGVKILFIIIGVLFLLSRFSAAHQQRQYHYQSNYHYQYPSSTY